MYGPSSFHSSVLVSKPSLLHLVDHRFETRSADGMSSSGPDSPTGSQDPSRQKHQYTSLSSLIHSPESGHTSKNGKDKARSGWHLASVEEESGAGAGSKAQANARSRNVGKPSKKAREKEAKSKRLSTWKMMALTISMGGSQVRMVDLCPIDIVAEVVCRSLGPCACGLSLRSIQHSPS